MRSIGFLVAISVFATAAGAGDPVLLASRRGGWIEAISLETLETVARFAVPAMTESVASDSVGKRLFFAAPRTPESGCCALYALDVATMQRSLLTEPAQVATVGGGRLYTQRGNIGIEAFDAETLQRLPRIKAGGMYRLQPSPDGRRLFGLTAWPKPALEVFDAAQGEMIASHAMPEGASLAGLWVGEEYLLLTVEAGAASVRRVSSESGDPGAGTRLDGAFPNCRQAPYGAAATGGRLAIYGMFGLKTDGSCAMPGGYAIADPGTGEMAGRFAARYRFRQMVAEGGYLYGLDVGNPAWQRRVRLVKIEAATGKIAAEREMGADVWYLTAGVMARAIGGDR